MWRRHVASWSLVTLLGAGCSGGQTSLGEVFREGNDPGPLTRVEIFLRPNLGKRESIPIAVGVTQDAVLGLPLVGGSSWRFEHAVSSRPELCDSVIVGVGGGEIFALRASSGALLWTRPSGSMELLGAGDDGDMTVVTLRSSAGQRNMVLVVGRDGQVLRQLETEQRLGRPAVLQGIAFVPWAERYMTAYDALLGREVARLSLRRGLSSALLDQGNLFFGAQALVRLDDQLALWPADELPRAEPPESPLIPSPRMTPRLEDARALFAGLPDRIRTYARATPIGEPLGLLRGRSYIGYHQAILARRGDGELPLWARLLERPAIGGDVFRGGLALCDEEGSVLLLGESRGTIEATLSLGQPVLSCIIQGGSLERAESGASVVLLSEQLAALLKAPESSLVPLQREALAMLDRLGDAETTRVLLDLCVDPKTPAIWLGELGNLIARRRQGAEAMLAALKRPLSQDRPPPVAALARALRSIRERRAAPLLLDHMETLQEDPPTILALAEALDGLATEAEIVRLRAAFERLRWAPQEALWRAAVALARALLRLDKSGGEKLVRGVLSDPKTPAALRGELAALLKAPRTP